MLLWLPAPALAEDPDEIVVVGEHDPTDLAATSAQVTVIPVDESLPGSADVATAVARAPGVQLQRLGGLGDLAQVGIRGASARQVEVLLDGIPLNPEGGSAVDLSELPLAALSRIDVYRGLSPALLGTGAIGGVVDLVTSDAGAVRMALSGGSWGTARASASASAGDWLAVADGLATAGGFDWYDDAGTREISDDDLVRARENNDAHQLATVLRWRRGDPTRLRGTLLHTGLWRDEGVPGFTFAPTQAVRYGVERHLVAGRLEGAARATRLDARAHALLRDEVLDDRLDEIGVGAGVIESRTRTVGLATSARHPVSPQVLVEVAASGQLDRFDDRGREVARAAAGLALGPSDGGWVLTPAVLGLAAPAATLALPRLGVKARAGPAVVLKANAGLAARPPDVVELFGDRGTLVGNPDLRPERGASVDAGVRAAARGVDGELVAFHRRVVDLIVWSQTPQGVARPTNVDRASIAGFEAAAGWRAEGVELSANGALTRATDTSGAPAYDGNQLPRVPVVELDARAAVTAAPLRLSSDVAFLAGSFADRANRTLHPPRLLWGATVSGSRGPWTVEIDGRNLLDEIVARVPRDPLVDDGETSPAPVVDVTGYPLPGRTFLVTLRLQP